MAKQIPSRQEALDFAAAIMPVLRENDLRSNRLGKLQAMTEKLEKENCLLRRLLAESPADIAKCESGFPGCGRADDMTA